MSSLFEMLSDQLGGNTLDQISRLLGADRQQTERAVPAAMASLMAGLARNSSRADGAGALAAALDRDHDGSVLDDLSGLLANPQAAGGDGILRHVLGGKRPAVESALSQSTGLDAQKVGQLLTLLAPLVLGALGRTRRSQGLDTGGLADLLKRERKTIDRRAPADLGMLGQLLDSDGDGDIKDDVAKMGVGLLGRLFGRRRR